MLTYKDIMEITGYSKSKAYEILRKLIKDFKEENPKALTFRGRIQKDYFYKRIYGIETKKENAVQKFSWYDYTTKQKIFQTKKGVLMKRKIKWGNWLLLIALIVCLITIGTDVFKIAIQPLFTGYSVSFTTYGLVTHLFILLAGISLSDYFESLMEE